jgi:hypothetical protein
MTMHLINGVCTLNTRKPKVKITKAKHQELVENHRKHNQFLKQIREKPITFEQYVNYVYGKKEKQSKRVATYKPTTLQPHSSTAKYESIKDKPSPNSCAKSAPMVYTGEQKLLGIATLHKSCLQPVFDADYAKDVAKMRRN